MLDAHPDVAMSYELYPSLLEVEDGSPEFVLGLADSFDRAGDFRVAAKTIGHRGLRTFFGRVPRGGLDHREVVEALRAHGEAGMGFAAEVERLGFIQRCAVAKMGRERKVRWGLKCTANYAAYRAVWPSASFLYMLRDGRDILASTLRTGSFNKTPATLAKSWVRGLRKFQEFSSSPDVSGSEVRYETLVRDPETEARRICGVVNLAFNPGMLEHHRKPLTIYGADHLSMVRIRRAVDDASVGRWRRDLTAAQLQEFREHAGRSLEELGYETSGSC